MKYTTLKSDIVSILHSSDYNLNLRFYDENGQTTLEPNDIQWIYVDNVNVMIEMATKDAPIIYIWKDIKNLNNDFKNIIQRIRQLSILNGVSVQIRVYNNLDQRKIYNLLKSSIEVSKEEKMNESTNNSVVNAFQTIITTAKNTKKSSDFYMAESVLQQNAKSLLSQMINEICSLNTLKNISLKESLNGLATVSSKTEIESFVNSLPKKVLAKLSECVNDIQNIAHFVRNEYLNNNPYSNTKSTIMVLENVKVYNSKDETIKSNLTKAYNKLISLNESMNDKVDLLKAIKVNHLEETFGVSKDDLIEFWLQNDGKPIELKNSFIIENYSGQKYVYNNSMKIGIKSLANYLNNNWSKDTQIYKNIINETIKYNDIADFIISYKDDYAVRKFIPKFKKLFLESSNKLLAKEFNQSLFESSNETINYNSEYNDLCKMIGTNHKAIKYLAIEEAYKNKIKNSLLFETQEKDMKILVEGLKEYVSCPSVIASIIIDKHLDVIIPITESVDDTINMAKSIYQQISNRPEKLYTSVSSTLFGIIHSKNLTKSKKDFISTLVKYK